MTFDDILTITFILLPLTFAAICLYYALYFLKIARQIQDTPTSKIRSAAQGFVELSGVTKPLIKTDTSINTTTPPLSTIGQLSKQPVAWSRFQVDQFITNQYTGDQYNENAQTYWTTIAQGATQSPFLLEDDTGRCIIFPQKAEIVPSETLIWYGSSPNGILPPKTFWQWLFAGSSGRFRYTEQHLNYGTTVYARGMFATLDQYPEVEKEYTHLIANTTNFPILSADELPKGYHFVISAIPANRLSRNYKLKAFVFFLGFLIFSAIILNSTYPIIKNLLFQ